MFRQKPESLDRFGFSLLSSGAFLLTMLLPNLSLISPATAVQFPNGEVAFNNPPRLVKTGVNFQHGNIPGTYYFTVEVSENAGEPLQAIKIKQATNIETVEFIAQESRAFHGSWRSEGASIPLASLGGPTPDLGEATIVFDQPVAPGSTVTIALQVRRNPSHGGIYLFGVTAFPKGENSRGQSIGFGRLHFYNGR